MKSDILEDLTPDDVRCLIESEDEFHRKGAFTRVFPSETSSKYFVYFEHIRYYNLLLDAWEKRYYKNRNTGISHLQQLCNEKYHLQINMHYKDSNQMPKIDISFFYFQIWTNYMILKILYFKLQSPQD
ncbi:Tubulin polyglutamylase TTLL4, partial [Stegodyphus mimosarum]